MAFSQAEVSLRANVYKRSAVCGRERITKMSKRMQDGFTLVQVLVAIVIVGIVAAIMFPVFFQARRCGRAISCVSNMKNIGLAFAMYTVDYDDALIKEYYGLVDKSATHRQPTDIRSYSWRYAIQPYLKNVNVLACPSNPVASNPNMWTNSVSYANGSNGQWVPGGYATNAAVIGFANAKVARLSPRLSLDSQITDPANTIVVADTRYVWNDARIDWIAGSMAGGPGLPPGSSYQAGVTPCGQKVGPNPPPDNNDPCAYDNLGTFQPHQTLIYRNTWIGETVNPHQAFVNFILADSHVHGMKLADTAVPTDMWNSGYSLAERTAIVQNMHAEYQ
jgi:prepilin-type N-terminal cleavage/methylation domain-containing protein